MTRSITEFLAAGQFTPCWSTANCDVFLTIAKGPCFNCTPRQSIERQIKPESGRSVVRIEGEGTPSCNNPFTSCETISSTSDKAAKFGCLEPRAIPRKTYRSGRPCKTLQWRLDDQTGDQGNSWLFTRGYRHMACRNPQSACQSPRRTRQGKCGCREIFSQITRCAARLRASCGGNDFSSKSGGNLRTLQGRNP